MMLHPIGAAPFGVVREPVARPRTLQSPSHLDEEGKEGCLSIVVDPDTVSSSPPPSPALTLAEVLDAGLTQAVTRGLERFAPLANNHTVVVLCFVELKGRYTVQLWQQGAASAEDLLSSTPLPGHPPMDLLPGNLIFERHTQANTMVRAIFPCLVAACLPVCAFLGALQPRHLLVVAWIMLEQGITQKPWLNNELVYLLDFDEQSGRYMALSHRFKRLLWLR
jgi:hypothetical protein